MRSFAAPNWGGGGVPLATLASLVALGLLLLSSLTASAQTGALLVNNLDLADSAASPNDFDAVQAFTTGSHSAGYTLTSVSLRFNVQNSNANSLLGYEVEVWSATALRQPQTKIATLKKPSTLVEGANEFSASGSGVQLSANTTYVIHWDVTRRDSGLVNSWIRWYETSNLAQSGAAGWDIRSKNSNRPWNTPSQSWTDYQLVSFQMRVDGHEGPPRSAPRSAPANPDPSNLARGAVQWDPVGAMHGLATRMAEIDSNKPSEPTGSVDLSNIAASVSEEREPHSRGFYLTTQVFGLGERLHLVRAGPNGARSIVDEDGQRYEVVSPGTLLLIKIWHVHYRPDRGTNSVELLGDTFLPRLDNRLTEPVEVCLPAPAGDAERVRIAVKGRLDPHWMILETTVKDGQVCAETVRVAWLTLVYAPEAAAV